MEKFYLDSNEFPCCTKCHSILMTSMKAITEHYLEEYDGYTFDICEDVESSNVLSQVAYCPNCGWEIEWEYFLEQTADMVEAEIAEERSCKS